MAEFQEVMRQWQRRCKHCTDENDDDCNIHSIVCDCFCSMKNFADYTLIEKEIMSWAMKHPEPVYPTWGDWFAERGDLIKLWQNIRVCSGHGSGVIGFLYDTIPADIAEKLGIEPKEDKND